MSPWEHRGRGEVILLDNRDSFVYNLAHRLWEVGLRSIAVVRSDEVTVDELASWSPSALVVSPGPGRPEDAGCSIEAIRYFHGVIPVLGICLGHQAIGVAFGGDVVVNAAPMHGRVSSMTHEGTGLLANVPSPCEVGRYHSLVVDRPLPRDFIEDGESDGFVMAMHHRDAPTFGIQFHPESVLTPDGYPMLSNFAACIGG